MSYVFIRETDINITDPLEDPASEQESVSRQGRGQADAHHTPYYQLCLRVHVISSVVSTLGGLVPYSG